MKLNHLLAEYQSRIIQTEDENEKFLEIVEKLLSCPQLTVEEKHYQLNSSMPYSRLLHLMEAQSLTRNDLVNILGDDEVVTKIINVQLEVTEEQAQALAKFFNVDASLFIF